MGTGSVRSMLSPWIRNSVDKLAALRDLLALTYHPISR
jgi:hypothetical protein